ncbi:MAG: hypothetical protein ACRDJP_11105, partial [Actinomycetota bacterium]
VQDLPGNTSPYASALDPARNRLILLEVRTTTPGTALRIIDTETLSLAGTVDLSAQAPGFVATGMTYSERDDRIYLVGLFEGSYRTSSNLLGGFDVAFSKVADPVPAVVALEGENGSVAWVRPVPECQRVLDSFGVGSLIAASTARPALYFFCITGGSGLGVIVDDTTTYPGRAGLIRLTIDGGAGMADAQGFPVEYFPVSGSYHTFPLKTGIAGFDPGSDRVFVQSVAKKTPGAWVFDGSLSAWVGFIAAPDNFNTTIGVDVGSGHYYMGSGKEDGYLVISDGRQTPVPQGLLLEQPVHGFVSTDPPTRRVFMKTTIEGESVYSVYRDNIPESEPLRPQDYDALTSDVDEGPDTVTSYSASVNGYGARVHLVGGATSAYSFLNSPPEHEEVRPGERAVTAARVPSVDLRDTGASASAQGGVADPLTTADLDGRGVAWPWEPVACLDGGGQPISASAPEANGATAEVGCDLDNQVATGRSSAHGLSAGGLTVAGSSFDTTSRRDPELGT